MDQFYLMRIPMLQISPQSSLLDKDKSEAKILLKRSLD